MVGSCSKGSLRRETKCDCAIAPSVTWCRVRCDGDTRAVEEEQRRETTNQSIYLSIDRHEDTRDGPNEWYPVLLKEGRDVDGTPGGERRRRCCASERASKRVRCNSAHAPPSHLSLSLKPTRAWYRERVHSRAHAYSGCALSIAICHVLWFSEK